MTPVRRELTGFILIGALECLLTFSACDPDTPAHSENGAVAVPAANCAPVRSVSWTRTPQLTAEHLKPLITLVRECGGEIGFGLIRDASNRPLIRLLLELPPVHPAAPPQK